jgi:hypothetical protein
MGGEKKHQIQKYAESAKGNEKDSVKVKCVNGIMYKGNEEEERMRVSNGNRNVYVYETNLG